MTAVMQQYEAHKEFGEKICERLISEIYKTGFSEDEIVDIPRFDQAKFELQKDPYTMDDNLVGSWLNEDGYRIGNIQFLSDGSFYAEYDVVKPHPTKSQWFVEGVTAWGKGDAITAEAKLLPVAE